MPCTTRTLRCARRARLRGIRAGLGVAVVLRRLRLGTSAVRHSTIYIIVQHSKTQYNIEHRWVGCDVCSAFSVMGMGMSAGVCGKKNIRRRLWPKEGGVQFLLLMRCEEKLSELRVAGIILQRVGLSASLQKEDCWDQSCLKMQLRGLETTFSFWDEVDPI